MDPVPAEFRAAAHDHGPFLFRGRTIQPISTPMIRTGITGFTLGSNRANATSSPTDHGDTRAQAAGRSRVGRASQKAPRISPTRSSAAPTPLPTSSIKMITAVTVEPIDRQPTCARFRRSSDSLTMANHNLPGSPSVGYRQSQTAPLNTVQQIQFSIRSSHSPRTDSVRHYDQPGTLGLQI